MPPKGRFRSERPFYLRPCYPTFSQWLITLFSEGRCWKKSLKTWASGSTVALPTSTSRFFCCSPSFFSFLIFFPFFPLLVKIKKGGGISFNAVVKLTHLNEKLVDLILREYSKPSCFFLLPFFSTRNLDVDFWVRSLVLQRSSTPKY